MKIVLDLKTGKELKENNIIIYKNGNWTVVSRESFLAKYINENRQSFKEVEKNEQRLDEKIDDTKEDLEKDIQKLQKDLVALAKIVKEK